MFEILLGAALALAALSDPAAQPAADEILVVDEDQLDRMWTVDRAQPVPPRIGRRLRRAACVTFGAVIEPDGTTSTHRVLRSEPKGVLDEAGLETIQKWRFVPGPDNAARVPVYTTLSLAWGPPSAEQMARCDVDIVVPKEGTAPAKFTF